MDLFWMIIYLESHKKNKNNLFLIHLWFFLIASSYMYFCLFYLGDIRRPPASLKQLIDADFNLPTSLSHCGRSSDPSSGCNWCIGLTIGSKTKPIQIMVILDFPPRLGVTGMLTSLAIELFLELVGKFGSLLAAFGSEASSYIFRMPSSRT